MALIRQDGVMIEDSSVTVNKLNADALQHLGSGTSRNQVVNQNPLSQGEAQRVGFSATLYSGNGTSQSVNAGIDLSTGDLGGLVWIKDRNNVNDHALADSVRGVTNHLESNNIVAEFDQLGSYVSALTATGFNVGSSSAVNSNAQDYVAWCFQTTKKVEPTFAANLLTGDSETFTSSLGFWADQSSGTGSVGGGSGNMNIVTLGVGNEGIAAHAITTEVGKAYTFTIDISSVDAVPVILGVSASSTVGTDLASKTITLDGTYSISFVATTTTSYVNVKNGSASSDTILVDNAFVREITSGTTNRGKPYTCHYNPDMGFSIVGYEGDGANGHEIPHHLGRTPDLSISKNRDVVSSWLVTGKVLGTDAYLLLNSTGSQTTLTNVGVSDDLTFSMIGATTSNNNNEETISYHFANTPGLIKVGKYIGTGAAGNYVECGFKPAFVMVKNLSGAADWVVVDSVRGLSVLLPNTSDAELGTARLQFSEDGFSLHDGNVSTNSLNAEYLFLAIAETGTAGNRVFAQYDYATAANEVTINQDTLISFAEGFNTNGEVNVQEQVGASTTFTIPAGNENKKLYLYKDKAGAYGVTEYRPLEEQDYFGIQSPLGNDVNLRTTARHFDYESSTGVASAGDDVGGSYPAWIAFDKPSNDIAVGSIWVANISGGFSVAWNQYKFKEPRVLKSWRLRDTGASTQRPDNFTIEGSNDGLNWVVVDNTYSASSWVSNGSNGTNLWSDLQDTSANTTAYFYYRINITANNGDVTYVGVQELEFNTITPSDRYDVVDGKMYDNTGTPISRVYLGEFRTDGDGDIIAETLVNYTPAKRKVIDEEVHGDLVVRGAIENRAVATAWVNFDGTQNPPLIRDSYNVADVVDLGTGTYRVVFEEPMDNIGYSAEIASLVGSVAFIGGVHGSANPDKNFIEVKYIRSDNAAAADNDECHVTITGGKDSK